MKIELDHTIVASHHKVASAKLLAELLDVPWAESALGYFSPVYVNEGLTLASMRSWRASTLPASRTGVPCRVR